MESENAIVVKDLQKSYDTLKVLLGVDFVVKKGTILALLGPNGAGKTTTIRILSTLLAPDGGRATINGHDVTSQPELVRASIGLTGQFAAVDEYLTGTENLQMIGRLYRMGWQEINSRAKSLIEQFDLVNDAARPVKTYSGGMRRKLDLAMSLISAPPIIFLDEPTTGLDPRSRLTMWEIIENLAAQGTTILLTTQYMEEADRLADNIVVIDNGRVIAEGTADALKKKVGADRLELVIAKNSNFDAAQKLMDGEVLQASQEDRSITIATGGGAKGLTSVLQKFEDAGIEVESVSLHKPTLDDVFLSLTGHAAVDHKEGTGQKNE